MESFVFALNSTVPVFLVILLGWFLRQIGMLNDGFNKTANDYVFKCALPVNLFLSISGMDFYGEFDAFFCLFCLISTVAMFLGVWAGAWLLIRDKRLVGAFAQASARSSAAMLGVTFAVAIYGSAGMVPMMIMFAIPLFNVLSVLILCFSPQMDESGTLLPRQGGTAAIRDACWNILKNPLILGIAAGIPFTLLGIQIPQMFHGALQYVGDTASPVALLVVGASFSGSEAMTRWKSAAWSSFVKLLLLPGIFLPAAAWLGFRGSELVAILIMTGSPTTVAGFVMARKMRADSVLTSNAVLLSTILSAFSITFWIYLLRNFGLI